MARYLDRDFTFEHPGEWEKRTIAGLARSAAFQAPTFLVVREPLAEGESLLTHAQKKLLALRAIQGFALLESGESVVGGIGAVRLRYSYTTQDGPIEQTQAFVLAPADRDEGVVTSLLATAREADVASVRPVFDAILASVRFDAAPASAVPRDLRLPDFPRPGARARD